MNVAKILNEPIKQAVLNLFEVTVEKIEFQATRRDFEGDITVVIFPLVKMIKGNPIEIGNKIGTYLVENVAVVEKFNVVSGFLNIVISDDYFINFFSSIKNDASFGFVLQNNSEKAVLVEYSSPNTNKPLHLGHVRNNLLGFSVAEIIKASGKKVYKTQIINDRGIHICKSMLAWQKFGNGQTPETSGLKGDHLVGKYYVRFDKEYKDQYSKLRDKHIEQVEKNIKELETTGVWGRLDSTLLEILDNSLRNFIKENVAVEISNDFLLKNIFFTSDFVLSTTKEEGIKDLRKSFISA
uniref:arginine--tRNA ligase domain-containing protein n=1 Tax=uncultured Flavobacterium sp. TaxID=165435 RepID=UPI00261AC3CC